MICIHCRLELADSAEVRDDMKVWVDLVDGQTTCPPPSTIPPGAFLSVTSHTPAYEISGDLLDEIVNYLGELAEIMDRIGEEGAEQVAQLCEIVSTDPKPVTA